MRDRDQFAFFRRSTPLRWLSRFVPLLLAFSLIITLFPSFNVANAGPNPQITNTPAPEPAFDQATTDEDTPVLIDVLANDLPENDPSLVIVAVGPPQSGTAEITDNRILYTPNPDFSGADSFFYSMHNGDPANTRQATVQVTVDPVNDGPVDIQLDTTTISEATPPGQPFAQFSVRSDRIARAPLTAVNLVEGDNDNAKFAIVNQQLQLQTQLDFETQQTYLIDVRARSLALFGRSFTKRFVIRVTDANDAPQAISLSNDRIVEQQPVGTTIGTLSSDDPDAGDTHTYALINGAGSADNARFRIQGDLLQTNALLRFAEKPIYSIRIAGTDADGGTFEQIFLVNVGKLTTEPINPNAPPASCSGDQITLIQGSGIRSAVVQITNPTVSGASVNGCTVTGTMKITTNGVTVDNLTFRGTVNQRDQFSSSSIADFTLTLAGITLRAGNVEIVYNNERPMLHITGPELVMPPEFGGLSAFVAQPTFIDSGGVRLGTGEINLPTIITDSGFELSLTGSLEDRDNGFAIVADGTLSIPNIGKKKTGDSEGQTCAISAGATISANLLGQTVLQIETSGTPTQPQPTLGPPTTEAALANFQLEAIRAGLQCSPGLAIGTTGLFLTGLSGEITLISGSERVDVTVTIEAGKELPGIGPILALDGSMGLQPRPFELDLGVALTVLSVEVARAEASITRSSFQASIRFEAIFFNGSASINAFTRNGRSTFTGSARISLEVKKGSIVEGKRCRFIRIRICPPPLPPFGVGPLASAGADVGEFTNNRFGFKGFVKILTFGTHGFFVDDRGKFKFGNVRDFQLVASPAVATARAARMEALSRGNVFSADNAAQGYTFLENVDGIPGNDGVIVSAPLTKPGVNTNPLLSPSITDVITQVNLLQHGDVIFSMVADEPLDFTLITPQGQEVTPANVDQSAVLGYTIEYLETTEFELVGTETADDVTGPRLLFTPLSAEAAVNGVDLRVDGRVVYFNLDFQQSTEWLRALPLAPGEHLIELVEPGTNNVVRSATVTLPDDDGQISLVSVGGSAPGLVVITDDPSAPSAFDKTKLRFFNGSDQPLTLFVDGAPLLSNVAYKSVSDFVEIDAGTQAITLRDGGGALVAELAAAELAGGGVYTFMSTDFSAGANPLTLIQREDALYQPSYLTYYSVDQAQMNEAWQMKLVGDTDNAFYQLSVQGPDSPPILGSVTVNAANPAATQVSWQLTSDNRPTRVSVFANPGPISATVPLTATDGTVSSEEIPLYEGILLEEYEVNNLAELGGQLVTKQLSLDTLPSGTYHLWVRADDGVNPPISTYAEAPGAAIAGTPSIYGTNAVWVAKDSFNPLASVSNAVAIVIDHNDDWPTEWEATINTTFEPETESLYIEWEAQTHPDTDSYRVLIGETPGNPTQAIAAGGGIQELNANGTATGVEVGFITLQDVRPGRTYFISIEGVDEDADRTVRSQEITFTVDPGSFSITSAQRTVTIPPGSTANVPVTLNVNETLFYPNIWLSTNLGRTPPGITARFVGDLDGLTTINPADPTHQLQISVDASVPRGTYPITITGYSGAADEQLTIQVIVGEAAIYLPLMSR